METMYKVRCKYCGTETELPRRGGFGKFQTTNLWQHIELDIPIRCPGCMHRLNASAEAFRSQVEQVAKRA